MSVAIWRPWPDIQTLCHDSRFDGTYLAYHHYSWDPDVQNLTTYDAWVADFKARMGNCASRTILEEFGATMDSALDYNDQTSTDREVLYLRDEDEGFAERVIALLKDRELAQAMGARGRTIAVARYDWRLSTERFDSLLAEVAR